MEPGQTSLIYVIHQLEGRAYCTVFERMPEKISFPEAWGLPSTHQIIAVVQFPSSLFLIHPLEFTCPPSQNITEASSSSVCSSEIPEQGKLPLF